MREHIAKTDPTETMLAVSLMVVTIRRRWPAHVNKDPGYFLEMVAEPGTRAPIAEDTSANVNAAVEAGMGSGYVPEIYDDFLKLGY